MNPNPEQPNDPNAVPPVTPPATPETPQEQPLTSAPTPAPEAPAFTASNPEAPAAPATTPTDPTPVAPFGAPAASTGAPVPPKGNKKGLIIGLIAAGAAILLLIIAAIVYFAFFTVTKADYRAANEQLNAVSKTVSIRPSISSSDSPQEATAELKEAVDNFKAENEKLGDLKALRADAELNGKYKAYEEKADGYVKLLDGFVPSLEKYFTALAAVRDLSGSATPAQYREAAKVIDENKDVTDPSLKAYLETLSKAYNDLAGIRERYEAAGSSTERLAASRELLEKSRELSTAARTLSDDLEKRYDAVNPRDTFNDLSRTVADKANQ